MECKNSNTFKLDLQNFQSIASAHLEFEEGINLIVGQGNSGKSATLRAIKAAILNTSGAHRFIKHGTDNTAVSIKYKENEIEWCRTKKEIKYNINNENYIKVGNSNLFKLLDNNGFVVDEKNNLMNIEGELELPFPFDRNSSELFKLFENIFCVSDSATILKSMKEEEDKNTRDKVKVEEELQRTNLKLSALEKLEEEIDLGKLKKGKEILVKLNSDYLKISNNIQYIKNTYNVINKLDLKIIDNNFSENSIKEYAKIIRDCSKVKLTRKFLQLIKDKKELPIITDNILIDYLKLCSDYKKIKIASKLSSIDIKDMSIDLKKVEKLEKINNDYTKLIVTNNLLKIAKSLELKDYNLNNFNKLEKIEKDYTNIKLHRRKATELKNKIIEETDTLKLIEEKLNSFKVCPLCGSNIGEE